MQACWMGAGKTQKDPSLMRTVTGYPRDELGKGFMLGHDRRFGNLAILQYVGQFLGDPKVIDLFHQSMILDFPLLR